MSDGEEDCISDDVESCRRIALDTSIDETPEEDCSLAEVDISEINEHEGCCAAGPPEYFDLARLGRIHIQETLCPDLVTPLLLELRDEPCGHSWQPILARVSRSRLFDALADSLARGRPGRVFTYFRETAAGGREALALATVSDRVTRTFPMEGLPVLGRAFVRRAARCKGLYPAILSHRLDYCQRRWGDRLMAVHLGASTPRVEHSFRKLHRGRVIYVGDEDLGEVGSVRALLGITDAFGKSLEDPSVAAGELPCAEHAAVLDFLSTGATATRLSSVAAQLRELAAHHAGFAALGHFFSHLPTLR